MPPGGALDTQIDGVTGVLFREQTVVGLCAAVERADKISFDPAVIQAHAGQFGTEIFKANLSAAILNALLEEPVGGERRLQTEQIGRERDFANVLQ